MSSDYLIKESMEKEPSLPFLRSNVLEESSYNLHENHQNESEINFDSSSSNLGKTSKSKIPTRSQKNDPIAYFLASLIFIIIILITLYIGWNGNNLNQVFSLNQAIIMATFMGVVWLIIGFFLPKIVDQALNENSRNLLNVSFLIMFLLELWFYFEAFHRPNLEALMRLRLLIILYVAFLGRIYANNLEYQNSLTFLFLLYLIYSFGLFVMTWINLWNSPENRQEKIF